MLFNVHVITRSPKSGESYRARFLSSGADWLSAQQKVIEHAFNVANAATFGEILGVSVILNSKVATMDPDYEFIGMDKVSNRPKRIES